MKRRAKRSRSTPELDFQNEIRTLARFYGWKFHHGRTAAVAASDGSVQYKTPLGGDPGFVDVVMAKGGKIIHAELKSLTGKQSADQLEWQEAMGVHYLLWSPRDMPEIVELLSDGRAKVTVPHAQVMRHEAKQRKR